MKQNGIRLSITFLTAFIVSIGVFFYTNSSKKIFIDQAYYSVQQSAEEKVSEIETSINYALNSIKLLSNFAASHMTEKELKNANEVLSSFSDDTPFNYIEYIRWDGLNFMNSTVDGQPFDASGRVYYQNGIKGISGIWENFNPKAAKEVLLNFYTPLYYEGEIAGVLTGAIGGNSGLKPLLKSYFFGQKMTSILCDENYTIISSTADNIPYGLNLKDFSDNKLVESIINHSEKKDALPFRYVEEGKEGISCIVEIPETNWKLIMIVLPKTLKASMAGITTRMYMIAAFVIIILLGYLITHITLQRKTSQKIEKKQLEIIDALGLIYQNVYSVNLKTSELYVYRMSDVINSRYGQAFPAGTYKEAMAIYIKNEVVEEDKKLFNAILDVESVREIFESTDEYSFIYRVERNKEIHYFQCYLFKSAKDADDFVAAFKDVDSMMEKQLEDQEKLNQMIDMQATQISILGSISAIYLTSHLIDLGKNMVVEFNTCSEVRAHVNAIENARGQMENVMKKVVAPEYLDEVLAFTNLDTIARRLRDKKIISMEFVGVYHGWIRASFINVERDENNLSKKVFFVTQVIDDEKKREQRLISNANSDELTGLLNRHAYEDDLRVFKNNNPENNFVYISFDVNGLKNVNDNLGHEAGDELIKGAAECLSKCFSPYGTVYRTGGDEFQAIIFADENKLEELKKDFVRSTENWTGRLVDELEISAGYVMKAENPELSIGEIIRLADQRMYKAKSLYYSAKGIDRRGQQAAFEVLCQSYTKILKVNLTQDEFTIIQMNTDEQNTLKGYNEKISLWLHNFGTSGQVHEDDVAEYLEKTEMSFLKNFFDTGNNLLSIQYRRKIGESFHRVMMEIIPSKDYTSNKQEIYLYVKNIDKE